jgi:broad specificity phosphatase PhoE
MSDALHLTYLARHGETAWPISPQHTGKTDLPPTSQGGARRLQASVYRNKARR